MINNGNNNNQNQIPENVIIQIPAQMPVPKDPCIMIPLRIEDTIYSLYLKMKDIDIPYIGQKHNLSLDDIKTLEKMQKNIVEQYKTGIRKFYLSLGGSVLLTFWGFKYDTPAKYTISALSLGGSSTYYFWNNKKTSESIEDFLSVLTDKGINLSPYFFDPKANHGIIHINRI